jgi:hypothetical protein
MRILLLFILTFSIFAEDRIKIGIIDTGISKQQSISKILCKGGRKSMARMNGIDYNSHGTNIFSLVSSGLDSKKVCIVSYQISLLDKNGADSYIAALNAAHHDGVKFLNISMRGFQPDPQERFLLAVLLYNKTTIIVAAGNENRDLDKTCDVYPPCYNLDNKRFHVVGSNNGNFTNYGSIVTDWEDGVNLGIPVKSGTSQATAVKTNKIIKESLKTWYNNRRR